MISILAIFSYHNTNSSNKKEKDNSVNNINNEDTNSIEENIPDNEDIVGKIKIDGTNIDEYIVQGSDNEYYLNHNLDKEEDIAGAVFLDYRNNFDDRKLVF